jgi:hypothetical protein
VSRGIIAFITLAAMAGALLVVGTLLALSREGEVHEPPSPAGVAFVTVGPGSVLPSGGACEALVTRSSFEPRPENAAANQYVAVPGVDFSLSAWDGYFGMNPAADALRRRIDGNFRGTTDEIIRWGACKWGFDEQVVRAVAVAESTWRQSTAGDVVGGVPQSFGLLQVKRTAHVGSYPASAKSTAWNVDYALAYRRACFEGWVEWLGQLDARYAAGDEWGCVGHWASGGWKDPAANAYVADVQRHLAERPWLKAGF